MWGVLEVTDKLIVDYRAREWCKLPYPNHPKGCPNYGKRFSCPPQAPRIEDWTDLYKKMWFVYVTFNLEEHAELMLLRHPRWTERQARCLLYWQPKVNKELKQVTWDFASDRLNRISYCPEAMGINVIQTVQNLGLPIEKKPTKMVYKISLVVS